jgi:hypothetical protein
VFLGSKKGLLITDLVSNFIKKKAAKIVCFFQQQGGKSL